MPAEKVILNLNKRRIVKARNALNFTEILELFDNCVV